MEVLDSWQAHEESAIHRHAHHNTPNDLKLARLLCYNQPNF